MSIKLKAGDYVSTTGITRAQYHEIAERFMAAGCPQGEYPNPEWAFGKDLYYFGWSLDLNKLYHGMLLEDEAGRELTPQQILNADQEEPSQIPIESLLKLAKEYAEEAAESQRKSEELYEKADKMYNELRGGAEGHVVEEDMTDPDNWRAGDVVEFTGESIHMTTGGHYHLRESEGGTAVDDCGDVKVLDDEGNMRFLFSAYEFKWLSRPSKETK